MVDRINTNTQNTQNSQPNPQRRTLENLVSIAQNLPEGERDTQNFQQINGQTLYSTVLINNVNMEFKDIVKMAGSKSKLIDLIKGQGLILPTYNVTIDQLVHNWIKRFWVTSMDKAPKSAKITRKNSVKVLMSNSNLQNANVRISDQWNADFLKDMAYTLVPSHPCWTNSRFDFSSINTNTQTLPQNEPLGLGDLNLPDNLFQNISNKRNRRVEEALSQAILDVRQEQQQPQTTQQQFNQNAPQQNQIINDQNNQQGNQQQDYELSRFLDYDGNFNLQEGEQLANCPICLIADNNLNFLRCCGGPMHEACLNHNLNSSRRCPFCRDPNARLQRRPLRRNQAVTSINTGNIQQQEEQKNQDDEANNDVDEMPINSNINQSQDI